MEHLFIVEHPFIKERLALLRDKSTETAVFRKALIECGSLLSFDICKNFEIETQYIDTPFEKTKVAFIKQPVVIIGILRAALGLVEGLVTYLPYAKIGHLGLYRDEKTLQPIEYYHKLPNQLEQSKIILADPMLATGGSLIAALNILKKHNCIENTVIATLIAAPEGVNAVHSHFPNVNIYTAALDRELNEKGYILPGLGDAGDRQYGTL